MWTHHINPELFHIGPFSIRYYGLVYVIGFIITYIILDHSRKKGRLNITRDDVVLFLLWIMIAVIVGSKLGVVLFWNPSYYITNPIRIVSFWKGGMAFHGGLIGVVIAVYWFSKKKQLSFWKVADILAIPAVFILALGRIANFINGEIWGSVTDVPWCIYFPEVGGCRHPYQIYAFLKRAFVGFILLFLNRKERQEGFITISFIFLFGIGRLFLDILREDPVYLSLKTGQWLSLMMVIVAGYTLLKYYRA
jgi:phosphatidylglycerol:prolipoprotein diacylglycerol transferase